MRRDQSSQGGRGAQVPAAAQVDPLRGSVAVVAVVSAVTVGMAVSTVMGVGGAGVGMTSTCAEGASYHLDSI